MTLATRALRRPLAILGSLALLSTMVTPVAAGPTTPRASDTDAEAARTPAVAGPATTPRALEPAYDPGLSLTLNTLRSGLSQPVFATNDGQHTWIYVVEKAGRIKILSSTGGFISTLLSITSLTSKGGEQGLLGLAFHPDYASNRRYYVNYTNTSGDTVIAEYRASPGGTYTVANSRRVLLTLNQPYANHNGGWLGFHEDDGYLYIALGDGGSAGDPGNRALDVNSPLGKILRIDVNHKQGSWQFAVPPDNPYVGTTGLDYIWARGLRNPWRVSFDRDTGDLWIGDVGQGRYEEINKVLNTDAGPGFRKNYGWRRYEGNACFNPSTNCSFTGHHAPLVVYSHSVSGSDNCSVTGGYVYRGASYPKLHGAYLYADVCSGRIWVLDAADDTPNPLLKRTISSAPVSFGETRDGELLLVTLQGSVLRIGAS